MKVIKFIRIFLLVLIVIGIGLICTQKIWVPKLVERIIESDRPVEIITIDSVPIASKKQAVTQFPSSGSVESVIIDFSVCSENTIVYTSFGSTMFEFVGVANGTCSFSYGSEAELSERHWYSCHVPVSLGKKSFNTKGFMNLHELDSYCSTK